MVEDQQRIFLDILRAGISDSSEMPVSFCDVDWQRIDELVARHSLWALALAGVSRIYETRGKEDNETKMPRRLMLKWLQRATWIRKRNMQLNRMATIVCAQLRDAGYRCCVLKGQGNAVMYPDLYVRTPGDIDIWVVGDRAMVSRACSMLLETNKQLGAMMDNDVRYHHYEMTIGDIRIELHCLPAMMNNPLHNHRLQRWFVSQSSQQCSHLISLPKGAGHIPAPTYAFNIVYQLVHVYHHFLDEGIGLRQIIDYYFVIFGRDKIDDTALCRTLRHLGLHDFAAAMMYVLHESFALPVADMIVPMDVRRGKVLLAEILEGGNFGRSYKRYGAFTRQSLLRKYFLKIYRIAHFLTHYPSEVVFEPLFRTWHWIWRQFNHRVSVFDSNKGGS